MGVYKKVLLGLITTITTINLMACSKTYNNDNKVSSTETNYYSISIDGHKKYYAEDNEDVTNIDKFAGEYLSYLVGTDYRNKEYLKEYDCYTKEITEEYEKLGYRESTEEDVLLWELILELNKYNLEEICFYKLNGKETADVTLKYESTVTHASEAYFEGNDIELNARYRRTMKLIVQKEDGLWKVYEYDIFDSEKV